MDFIISETFMKDLCNNYDWKSDSKSWTSIATSTTTSATQNLMQHQGYQGLNGTSSNFTTLDICSKTMINMMLLDEYPDSRSTLQNIQYYLSGICSLIVCILGLIGNMMAVAVLIRHKYTQTSTFIYLVGLTISDSFFLTFALLINMRDIVSSKWSDSFNTYHAYAFPFYAAFTSVFHTSSIWLTLGFTVDRYIMICHPFHGAKLCSRRRSTIVVIALHVAAVLYSIPKFFEYKTIRENVEGKELVVSIHSRFGSSKLYLDIVHFWTYLFFIFVIPIGVLTILNTCLIIAVRKSKSRGRRLSMGMDGTKSRNDTTVMLCGVVVVFLVCQLPGLISHSIWASMPSLVVFGGEDYHYLNIIQEIANFLVTLNSAINILLYYVFSRKFRKDFTDTICWPCKNTSKCIAKQVSDHLSVSRSNRKTSNTNQLLPRNRSHASVSNLGVNSQQCYGNPHRVGRLGKSGGKNNEECIPMLSYSNTQDSKQSYGKSFSCALPSQGSSESFNHAIIPEAQQSLEAKV